MQSNDNLRADMAPMVNGKLWMKLLGVMMIITGALQVLSIIGILWAWVPIWLGVLLFQAAGAAEEASATGAVAAATRATDKLRLFFMIQGILLLISLIVFALAMLLGGAAMFAGLAGMAGSY